MQQWEINTFSGAFIAFFISTCLFFCQSVSSQWEKLANYTALLGFFFNTLTIVFRVINSNYFPITNIYEFGIFFIWFIVLIFLILTYYHKIKIGVIILPITLILTGIISSFYQVSNPIIPELKSNWLVVHVLSAVVAYGSFAVSFAFSVIYLWKNEIQDSRIVKLLPPLNIIEEYLHKSIFFAMPFLTLVIITGSIWAEYVWGTYWQWDPKETWSLITWLIYAIYIHGKVVKNWRGTKLAIWSVLGFIFMIATFILVNILLPGLHNY